MSQRVNQSPMARDGQHTMNLRSVVDKVGRMALGQHDTLAENDRAAPYTLVGAVLVYVAAYFAVGIPLDIVLPDEIDVWFTVAWVILSWYFLWSRVPGAFGPPYRLGGGLVLLGAGLVMIHLKFLGPPLLLLVAGFTAFLVGGRMVTNTLDIGATSNDAKPES